MLQGSIPNEPIDEASGLAPVTFGDDLRIDGWIWRYQTPLEEDELPLQISDSVVPGLSDVNDLGDEDLRWRDAAPLPGLDASGWILTWFDTCGCETVGCSDTMHPSDCSTADITCECDTLHDTCEGDDPDCEVGVEQ